MRKPEKSRTTIGGNVNKTVDENALPVLEVEKNNSLGMLIGVAGAVTYFGTLDQTKWRASYNAKRVFDKYDSLLNVDMNADQRKVAEKAFQTFFQSATSPVAAIGAKFKVTVKDATPSPAPESEKASVDVATEAALFKAKEMLDAAASEASPLDEPAVEATKSE